MRICISPLFNKAEAFQCRSYEHTQLNGGEGQSGLSCNLREGGRERLLASEKALLGVQESVENKRGALSLSLPRAFAREGGYPPSTCAILTPKHTHTTPPPPAAILALPNDRRTDGRKPWEMEQEREEREERERERLAGAGLSPSYGPPYGNVGFNYCPNRRTRRWKRGERKRRGGNEDKWTLFAQFRRFFLSPPSPLGQIFGR